jgi:hypothetical protein
MSDKVSKKGLLSGSVYALCAMFLLTCETPKAPEEPNKKADAGTPENPGEIHVLYYQNGQKLTISELERDKSAKYNYDLQRSTMGATPHFVLRAIHQVRLGASLGQIDPGYKKSTIQNKVTGAVESFDQAFSGMAYASPYFVNDIRVSGRVKKISNRTLSQSHQADMLNARHEMCHQVDFKYRVLQPQDEWLALYRQDIETAKKKGVLNQIWTYLLGVENGGYHDDVTQAVPEVFAELCAMYLEGRPLLVGYDTKKLKGQFPKFSKQVEVVLNELNRKYQGIPYEYKIIGVEGDQPFSATNVSALDIRHP